MIVEEQGIGFRTGVRFPSGPLKHENPNSMSSDFLLYRKYLVTLTCESFSCKAKTLREDRRGADKEFVAAQPRPAQEFASKLFVMFLYDYSTTLTHTLISFDPRFANAK